MSEESSKPQGVEDKGELTFAERAKGVTVKAVLKRPVTVAAIFLMVVVVGLVIYLESRNLVIDLPPPEVSYELLPNEGRTGGVPVAIKLNQIAVFMINDPMESGEGADRAKEVVERLQELVNVAVEEPGKTLRIDYESDDMPIIVLTEADGTDQRPVIQVQKGDLALAGDSDAKRVARLWAERLTDTIKLLAFAEPPKFSSGTAFGDALLAMHTASITADGVITEDSLEDGFDSLPDRQRLALETLPTQAPKEEQLAGAGI